MSEPSQLLDAYLEAVVAGSRARATGVIGDARAAGLDIRGVYMEIFQPALREVGRLWQESRITVADEHLATAITQSLMAQLYAELFEAAEAPERTLIAACVDVERHEVGLRMVCDLLEMAGWDTTYLGSTVPATALVDMVEERRPDAVALSVSLDPHLSNLKRTVAGIRSRLGASAPVIMVGGRPFLADPTRGGDVGADIVAMDAAEAVARLQEHFSRI